MISRLALLPLLAAAAAGEAPALFMWHTEKVYEHQVDYYGLKHSGCQITQVHFNLRCRDPKTSKATKLVTDRAFRSVVDCKAMRGDFKSLILRPSDSCGKLVATHQETGSLSPVSEEVEVRKGEVVNITCVALPLCNARPSLHIGDRQRCGRYRRGSNMDRNCQRGGGSSQHRRGPGGRKAVLQSGHRSLPVEVEATYVVTPENLSTSLPPESSTCVKDLPFKDLKPQVHSDSAPADAFQLQVFDAPKALQQPGKHEETVKLLVDATKLAKGARTVKVKIIYIIKELNSLELELPVENPSLPDGQPIGPPGDAGGEPGTSPTAAPQGFNWIWILLILLVAAGVGAFFYRRHLLIQAHAREVP